MHRLVYYPSEGLVRMRVGHSRCVGGIRPKCRLATPHWAWAWNFDWYAQRRGWNRAWKGCDALSMNITSFFSGRRLRWIPMPSLNAVRLFLEEKTSKKSWPIRNASFLAAFRQQLEFVFKSQVYASPLLCYVCQLLLRELIFPLTMCAAKSINTKLYLIIISSSRMVVEQRLLVSIVRAREFGIHESVEKPQPFAQWERSLPARWINWRSKVQFFRPARV